MSTQLESSEAAILSRVIQPDSGDWPQAAAEAILRIRSEEHTSELQSRSDLVCRLLLEKKKKKRSKHVNRNLDQHESQDERTIPLVHDLNPNMPQYLAAIVARRATAARRCRTLPHEQLA